ncbi:multicopper oxidase family protein [Mesorhizobium sp.]|uniref:multicopper oxidase family protein n=1 Tax=Mesorhizobium sp. TaxID=1871066 RepID=UPI000FD5D4F6|nr:multicopper oxidase family protein [Mesorhizobium sp.]RVC53926.1 multicopper oxidase family protein [Mesorhizobium sp. M4B.F.Ca.ET.088.02.2.1]RWF31139.1 MAG: multicopper oxidase family protein [Mesorhizobium sp.]TIX14651.1 MAG: multicopper oxidase family protein [Mesorhizobium sp.]TJW05887.1 MAG: multicopper oxidase family protein [Mesorhizobium sp.]
MHRRGFLAAGLATVLASPRALAQMKMDDMSGMDMSGHGGHDMGAMAEGAVTLPEGEVLRDLPLLANAAGRPGLFKARLTAEAAVTRFAEGLDTPILAYNGTSPGPLIEAFEGDRVEITFANRIEGEASTIHWHGMPVPADQDGNPMDPVAAGTERVYAFELPEGSAGSYWYHPHPHGTTAEQVYRGLAGAFVVKAKADPVPAEYGDTVLVLTDLRLAADGSMPANTMTDLMNGRVGDHVLVNGQKNPRLAVTKGAVRRLRLYNATNARFLKLAFEGAAMTVIGTDGGLLAAPVAADEILLSPGERIELVVSFGRPGLVTLATLDYDRGWMGPGRPADGRLTLLTVDVSEEAGGAMPPPPASLRPIAPLPAPAFSRRLVFSETVAMNATGMEMGFLINGKAFDMARVDIVGKAGETELWEIVNQADMDHPFHVHGTQFQVIEHERDGKISRPPFLAWKDTVNVARGETLRLLLRQEQPGRRMYHCHILEHEQLGMMGVLDVTA